MPFVTRFLIKDGPQVKVMESKLGIDNYFFNHLCHPADELVFHGINLIQLQTQEGYF